MKIGEVTDCLESLAPLSYQESYDNSGLIVGDRSTEVKGILVCLDSTEKVLEEAIEKGANMVIAHHPIVFSGLKKYNGSNYVERTVMKAIKNDIAIYAIHTNLDNVLGGVNRRIADKLGLQNCKILAPSGKLRKLVTYAPLQAADVVKDALFVAGAGHIGNYSDCSFSQSGHGTFKAQSGAIPSAGKVGERHSEPEQRIEVVFPNHIQSGLISALKQVHPYEEVAYDVYDQVIENPLVGAGIVGDLSAEVESRTFLEKAKEVFKTGIVRHTALVRKSVKRVAVCGGAGSFLLPHAIRNKADVFITGDYKYHQFFDAEDKIIIADVGHYESEQFTIDLLGDLLKDKFPTFAILLTEVNTNPVNYL